MKKILLVCAIVLSTASLCAYSNTSYQNNQMTSEATVKTMNNPRLGKILTDSKGRTLYIFTTDKPNASNCMDQCAITWPPLLISVGQPSGASDVTGKLDVLRRPDNKIQVTYNGMPLYYYNKDSKAGDINGQGVDSTWYVINPDSGPVMGENQY